MASQLGVLMEKRALTTESFDGGEGITIESRQKRGRPWLGGVSTKERATLVGSLDEGDMSSQLRDLTEEQASQLLTDGFVVDERNERYG